MTSLVLTCLLGLATPLAGQQTRAAGHADHGAAAPGPTRSGSGSAASRASRPRRAEAPAAATPAAAPAPEAPTLAKPSMAHYDSSSLQNIRIEVTLTDSLQTEGPSKKTVTMMVVDNNSGQIRSQGPSNYVAQRRCRAALASRRKNLPVAFALLRAGTRRQRVRNGAHARDAQRSRQRHPRGRQTDAALSIGRSAGRSEGDGGSDGDGREVTMRIKFELSSQNFELRTSTQTRVLSAVPSSGF